MQFSIVAAPTYSPSRSVERFPSLDWSFLKAQSFVLTYISQESTSSSPLHEHRGPALVLPSSVLGLGETTLEELARILPAAPWGVRACLHSVFMD